MHGTRNGLKPVASGSCSFAYWVFLAITFFSKIHTLKMVYSLKSTVHGQHIYKQIWTTMVGRKLSYLLLSNKTVAAIQRQLLEALTKAAAGNDAAL